MKSLLVFVIFLALTLKYKHNFISLITGVIACIALIRVLLALSDYLKQLGKTDETELSEAKPRKLPKKKLSKYELELFAKQCNSALEYEDKKEKWNSESNKL